MNKRKEILFLTLFLGIVAVFLGNVVVSADSGNVGKNWYVSPNGNALGDGSKVNPWDLQTALSGGKNPPKIQPGDTVWLLSGVYGTGGGYAFFSTLSGSSSQPIYFRQAEGGRATLNGSLEIDGDYVWFWGFEIENSNWRRMVADCGSFGNTVSDGIHFKQGSVGSKMINLVIHDVSNGIADQQESSGTEDYGNLIYNTGWDNTTHNGNDCRGHGHNLYLQNNSAMPKIIENNITYNSFAENIQGFGSQPAISHLHFVGNTAFNAGMNRERTANMTLGGGSVPHQDILFDNNVVYQALNTERDNTGYNDMEPSWNGQQGKDLTMTGNYWVGATPSIYGTLYLKNWETVNFTGNTVVGQIAYAAGTLRSFNGSLNRYFNSRPPAGSNDDSPVVNNNPTGVDVVVRPNKYETGRANITILNWDKRPSVPIDLSRANIPEGADFEIRDAQNFWGAPVYEGTYHKSNSIITLSMASISAPVSEITGTITSGFPLPKTPAHTSEEFGAFIVLPKGTVSITLPLAPTLPPMVTTSSMNPNPPPVQKSPIVVLPPAPAPAPASVSPIIKSSTQVYVVIPDLSPAPGYYNSSVTVSLSGQTPGTQIYYTVNGSTPTQFSHLYTGPFTVTKSQVVKAVGFIGENQSGVASGSYEIILDNQISSTTPSAQNTNVFPADPVYVVIPDFVTPPGFYNDSVTVVLSEQTPGAKIYYTTDGSTPTKNSILYSTPFVVQKSSAVKAVGFIGDISSGVASGGFSIIDKITE